MNLSDVTYVCLIQTNVIDYYLSDDEQVDIYDLFVNLGYDVVYYSGLHVSEDDPNFDGSPLEGWQRPSEPFIVVRVNEFTPDVILDELRPSGVYPSIDNLSIDYLESSDQVLNIWLRQ